MGIPTRYPGGVTNSSPGGDMEHLRLLDPTVNHIYMNDFDTYVAADWTITTTEAGGGDATEALADEDGGVLLITNDAGDNDNDFFNLKGEGWLLETGKKLHFKARLKVSDATESDFVCGLQITDTSPLATVTDGIYFQKDDGDEKLDFHVVKNSTATDELNVATVVDATYLVMAFYYDGDSAIDVFINDDRVAIVAVTNLPDDTELTVSFGIQNGEAVAKTMSVDYLFVSKER